MFKNANISPEQLQRLKITYPNGTRVKLLFMDDPYTKLLPGAKGTVQFVDDAGTVHIAWDNGEHLGAIYGEDKICRI